MIAVVAAAAAAALVAGAPADPVGRHTFLLGHSADGRPLVALERGDLDSPRKALVVGCIHGNECAGVAVANVLERSPALRETDLWIVPDLNPDGRARGARQNAHGVDLNRNFPWRWRPLTGIYASGPRPLSEPESRIAARLIARVRPAVSIWFHQHLGVVDDSTGSVAIERRFARVAGMQLQALTREPGSAVTWETHCLRGATAFVVELPPGEQTRADSHRIAAAVAEAAEAAPAMRPAFEPQCASSR